MFFFVFVLVCCCWCIWQVSIHVLRMNCHLCALTEGQRIWAVAPRWILCLYHLLFSDPHLIMSLTVSQEAHHHSGTSCPRRSVSSFNLYLNIWDIILCAFYLILLSQFYLFFVLGKLHKERCHIASSYRRRLVFKWSTIVYLQIFSNFMCNNFISFFGTGIYIFNT